MSDQPEEQHEPVQQQEQQDQQQQQQQEQTESAPVEGGAPAEGGAPSAPEGGNAAPAAEGGESKPARTGPPDVSNLFSVKINNIPFECRREHLEDVFKVYGPVKDVSGVLLQPPPSPDPPPCTRSTNPSHPHNA